jgi:rhodanese-related sulfurtransferase
LAIAAENPARHKSFDRGIPASSFKRGNDGKIPLMREGTISPAALLDRITAGDAPAVLDVRSPGEFAAGHVPGAVNVPFTSVLAGMDGVRAPKSRTVVVYCGHGPRAWLAGAALRWRGYLRVTYLRGHMAAWRRAGLREER